jgi:hypothetical protein
MNSKKLLLILCGSDRTEAVREILEATDSWSAPSLDRLTIYMGVRIIRIRKFLSVLEAAASEGSRDAR